MGSFKWWYPKKGRFLNKKSKIHDRPNHWTSLIIRVDQGTYKHDLTSLTTTPLSSSSSSYFCLPKVFPSPFAKNTADLLLSWSTPCTTLTPGSSSQPISQALSQPLKPPPSGLWILLTTFPIFFSFSSSDSMPATCFSSAVFEYVSSDWLTSPHFSKEASPYSPWLAASVLEGKKMFSAWLLEDKEVFSAWVIEDKEAFILSCSAVVFLV